MTTHPIPPIPNEAGLEWTEHPRFRDIWVKKLITSQENPFASINVVRVPPGGVIGWHGHAEQIETVYALAGQSALTLGKTEVPFGAGQIVAIPPGLQHTLRNTGLEDVKLLTVFTPPLA